MDPVQAEILSTVFEGAPYVIGAYVLMWLVLLAYLVYTSLGERKTEQHLAALEEALSQARQSALQQHKAFVEALNAEETLSQARQSTPPPAL